MDDPRILFGQQVRKLRKAMGMSQEEFAYKSGIDRSYMGGIERGERNVALLNICRIADALEVTPAELMMFSTDNGQVQKPRKQKQV